MMYLSEPKFFDIVTRQFRFKMNANAAAFTTLILLQVFSLFTSLNSNSTFGYEDTLRISLYQLSNNSIVGVTWLWAIILGFLLTSAAQRNESFSFVSNRLSYHSANLLFMLTASIIAGITSVLAGSAVKLFAHIRFGEVFLDSQGLIAAPSDFLIQLATAIAYTLLFFMISYAVGMLIQLNKVFILLFIGAWIVSPIIASTKGNLPIIQPIFEFFAFEQFILFFLIKVSVAVLGLLVFSVAITNHLEVRK